MKKIFFFISIILVFCLGVFFTTKGTGIERENIEKSEETETAAVQNEQKEEEVEEEKETNGLEDEVVDEDVFLQEMLRQMTIEQKVGQLFFVRVPETNAIADITTYHLGGYLLFQRDFDGETPASFIEKINAYQEKAQVPMLIGSDEEGGTVSRIGRAGGFLSSPFQSPQELYADGGMEAIETDAQKKSEILQSYGINVNLAPVADISTDSNSFIFDRTVGLDARGTAEYVRTVVMVMEEMQIGSSLKHFPGYGDNADSHMDIVYDTRSLNQLRNHDFMPFREGIEAGADSVLVSHNIVTSLNADLPASIAPEVYQIIRDEMDFDGVILTDDMDMAGIANYISQEEAALAAIQAGADMILTSQYPTQIARLLEAISSGELSEERIDESVLRVLRWKQELGLLETSS